MPFKENHFTLQTSRNRHMESATTFQTGHCISKGSIMLSNYGSIQDHFYLSFYNHAYIGRIWMLVFYILADARTHIQL